MDTDIDRRWKAAIKQAAQEIVNQTEDTLDVVAEDIVYMVLEAFSQQGFQMKDQATCPSGV